MKKKILMLSLLLVFISGCSSKDTSKNLRCEKSEVVSENTINEVITATFENDNIKTADIKIETVVAEKYIPYIDSLEEDLKTKYEGYYNKSGIDINIAVGTSSITTKINVIFDNLNDESKQVLGFSELISTYAETKSSLENSGYKCK